MLQTITSISQVIVGIVTSIVFVCGVFALFRGGWKCLKNFNRFSKKSSLFMDKMMPDILSHLESTDRIPKNTTAKWLEVSCTCSPISITSKGWEVIKKSNLEALFNENKDLWLEEVRKKNPTDSLDLEKKCFDYIDEIIKSSPVFKPIKEYVFRNPEELKMAIVSSLLGIMLRDYCIEKKLVIA